MATPKQQTLVFIHNGKHVLLGLKKAGFASGKWNGYGGKTKHGETAVECAVRELEEESEIQVSCDKLCFVGVLRVKLGGAISNDRDVHLFTINYETLELPGEPRETEEMRPQWFHVDDLPFDAMLPDASKWLPALLQERKFDVTIWRSEETGDFTHDIQFH